MNTTESIPPKLYQLTLFYNNLKSVKTTVSDFNKAIKDLSDNKYRVLSFGSEICAIGFVASVEPERLHKHLSKIPFNGEAFNFLLVEVSGIIAGALYEESFRWLDKSPVEYKFWREKRL